MDWTLYEMYMWSNNEVANSMDQNTSGEASRCLGTHVIHPHSMELEGSLPFSQDPARVSLLSQMNPFCVITFQYISNKMQRYTFYFIGKLLYMFRVVPPPIIRSANNCIYIVWYLSHRVLWMAYATHSTLKPVPTLPRYRQVAVTVWQIPDAVDTVVCCPDDGWWYHPKHVEQFSDKINCVTLHLVGYILEYSYDARTHER